MLADGRVGVETTYKEGANEIGFLILFQRLANMEIKGR
jgi:hypothetical protein